MKEDKWFWHRLTVCSLGASTFVTLSAVVTKLVELGTLSIPMGTALGMMFIASAALLTVVGVVFGVRRLDRDQLAQKADAELIARNQRKLLVKALLLQAELSRPQRLLDEGDQSVLEQAYKSVLQEYKNTADGDSDV